jgi:hypothetical protein
MRSMFISVLMGAVLFLSSCSKTNVTNTPPPPPPGGGQTPTITVTVWPVISVPFDVTLEGNTSFNVNDVLVLRVLYQQTNDAIKSGKLELTNSANNQVLQSAVYSNLSTSPDIKFVTSCTANFCDRYVDITVKLTSTLAGKQIGIKVTLDGTLTSGSHSIAKAFKVNP